MLCSYSYFGVAEESAAAQAVVPVEGDAFDAELVSISADGRVTFRVAPPKGTDTEVTSSPATAPSPGEQKAAVRTMRLDELVRWGHPVEARPHTIIVLADGGQIVTAADWSGGAAVRLDDDTVVALSDSFKEIRVPRALVRGVVFALQRRLADRARLVARVRSFGGKDDAVLLTNRDRLTGKLTELARGSLTIETEAGAAKLPLSRIEAVVFGSRQPSAVSRQPKLIVGLRDGSQLYADSAERNNEHLILRLNNGLTIEGGGGGGADLVALQSVHGRFVHLSDLEPTDYRHVPYLSIEWPYKRDRNVLDEPLVVGGKRYLKGIGMHSAARLTYALDGKYRRFDSVVAVDDSAGLRGSVTFGAYVLRDGKWNEAYTSGIVRGGDAPENLSIDVSGAQGLTLTVDYADRGDERDHADWLDARLVKN